MAAQDFRLARLFGTPEPLLEAIERRRRIRSAEDRAMGIEQMIDYALQRSMNIGSYTPADSSGIIGS